MLTNRLHGDVQWRAWHCQCSPTDCMIMFSEEHGTANAHQQTAWWCSVKSMALPMLTNRLHDNVQWRAWHCQCSPTNCMMMFSEEHGTANAHHSKKHLHELPSLIYTLPSWTPLSCYMSPLPLPNLPTSIQVQLFSVHVCKHKPLTLSGLLRYIHVTVGVVHGQIPCLCDFSCNHTGH